MLKPNLKDVKIGTIYQISPEDRTDPNSIRYGGDFLIVKDLEDVREWGVQGYLALVSEQPNVVRFKGVAFVRIKWDLLEPVGSVEWLQANQNEKEENNEQTESK